MQQLRIYFSDFFNISRETMHAYGVFDVSLINDLPMFIDPFLLFNSDNPEYRALHAEMIKYVKFLRDKSSESELDKGSMYAWYIFKEIKQNWLGFSRSGNRGRGLGPDFASALHKSLHTTFKDFGEEEVPESPHFEKLTLFDSGVGKDNVSDFTTNLIKKYLLGYTQEFARQYIDPALTKDFAVRRAEFNYKTETWVSRTYRLPTFLGDYVLLTRRVGRGWGFGFSDGGREHFAVSLYHPPPGLTGYYALRGKCYTTHAWQVLPLKIMC